MYLERYTLISCVLGINLVDKLNFCSTLKILNQYFVLILQFLEFSLLSGHLIDNKNKILI